MVIHSVRESAYRLGRSNGAVVLMGTAASTGWASGRARVLITPSHVRLARGEILVIPDLQPVWWPLFPTVSGIVAAQGALLAGAATVAREYRLPMVVVASEAILGIVTGQSITLDGGRGLVFLGGRHWDL